MAKTAACRRQQ